MKEIGQMSGSSKLLYLGRHHHHHQASQGGGGGEAFCPPRTMAAGVNSFRNLILVGRNETLDVPRVFLFALLWQR